MNTGSRICALACALSACVLSAQGPSATPTLPSAPAAGQSVESTDLVGQVANSRPWEYGALIQGGNGLEERTDFRFLMVGVHLGKVLTTDFGTGTFKGNFEYAVEVFPLWQSYTPKFQRISCVDAPVPTNGTDPICSQPYTVGGTYTGVSITPIMLRYNFTHGKRFMPWIQAAGGVVWTNHKYPGVGNLDPTDPTQTGPASDTSVWNFTPQGGIGAHYFVRPKRSFDASINGVHISSSSLGDKNPGVNVSVQVSVGYTWWK
jgi:lipid A 3-O-deacylase